MALHSATLCKSDFFQHNYAGLNDLVDKSNEILEKKIQPSIGMKSLSVEGFMGLHAMPLVTIFQSDGGLYQNITFLHYRIAELAYLLAIRSRLLYIFLWMLGRVISDTLQKDYVSSEHSCQ